MFWPSPSFDKLLEKATSSHLLEPDWPTILQICDLIRQGDVQPKKAVAAIKQKLTHSNPHVALYSLLILESCVKNCGNLIHDEIGTKQFMEQLRELVKTSQHEKVKAKILELIQVWAFAFRNSPNYRAVQDTLNIMRAEGYKFPTLKESDAMFSADTAPQWKDGDVCNRCRVEFGLLQRKHHCRACGQVFCSQCSNKFSPIPKFGFEKEVRVCESCYDKVNKATSSSTKETDLPAEYLSSSLAQQQQVPPRKTAEELREEEELQLAIALSQSEAEQKEKEKKRITSALKTNMSTPKAKYSPPPSPVPSPSKTKEEDIDPELAKYLNRQYWEHRQSTIDEATRASVASPSAPNISSPMPQKFIVAKHQNGEVDSEIENFVGELRSQVEIFVNRMKSNSSRGRSIAIDSSVQSLFMTVTDMHCKLLRYIQEQDDKRVYYEGLQDKLVQIKDARAALDALREEHREKLRRQAEEAERQRQLQMAHKLEIMRKKKQEYLQYQRQLALQRIQEQEREMQMRQEQQKQQYIMGGYQSVSGYIGQTSQNSPVRHVQYPNSGANYTAMSPTNQNMFVYRRYPNYGVPQAPQQGPVDLSTTPQGREATLPQSSMPVPGMIPQMRSHQMGTPQGLSNRMGPGAPNIQVLPQQGGVVPNPQVLPQQGQGASNPQVLGQQGPPSNQMMQMSLSQPGPQLGPSQPHQVQPQQHVGIPQIPSQQPTGQLTQNTSNASIVTQSQPIQSTQTSNVSLIPSMAPNMPQVAGTLGQQTIQFPSSVMQPAPIEKPQSNTETAELISFD